MATALVLAADGRRKNGRWQRGTTAIYESVNSDNAWSVRMAEAGTILDFRPELAERGCLRGQSDSAERRYREQRLARATVSAGRREQ